MKAIKRTVSVLLSLMLVLGMVTMGISVASAAENTITYTSNIGAQGTKTYVPGTDKQVTVTYNLKTSTRIINAQAVVTFDPAVLKLADGQTAATVCPNIPGATVNLTKSGRVPFAASDFAGGYDFSAGGAFVTVIFDIIGSGNTTVNLAVDTLTGTTTPNTSSANDVPVVIAEELQEGAAITPTAEAEVSGESGVNFDALINDVRLDLQGRIGFKFYFRNAPDGYSIDNLKVSFDGPSAAENTKVNGSTGKIAVKSLKGTKYNGVPSRLQDYFVCAYMLTEPVKVNFYDNDQFIGTYSISAAQWVKDHLAEFEASNPKAALVAKRMLNYGAAVQAQFASNLDARFTTTMANEGIDLATTPITADTIVVPSGVNVNPTNLATIGIASFRNTVELKEGVDIQLGVKVGDAEKFKNAAVTCDGVDLPFVSTNTSGTQKRATLENVVSNKLDTVYTFNFSNGETYKTSVLSYMKTLIAASPNNATLVNLVSAAYWYNQAANDAFGD